MNKLTKTPKNSLPLTSPAKTTSNALEMAPIYQVVLYNDDWNDFDHVVACLIQVFSHPVRLALKLTDEAHNTGRTIVAVEEKSLAQLHKEQLQSYSLTCEIEPVG